jgi:hypothetical protein
MSHPLCRVTNFQVLEDYCVRVEFDDGVVTTIDFAPVLKGEIFGPLRDRGLFSRVTLDPEAHTLVWPNGADFDPATLHDWPRYEAEMRQRAQAWAESTVLLPRGG